MSSRAAIAQLEVAVHQRRGVLRDERGVRDRQRLDPLSDPHGVAGRHVLQRQIVPHRTGHDLAGVQPDADGEVKAAAAAQVGAEAGQLLQQPQGGVAAARGVILLGEGAPNSAIKPSPVNWSTIPSKRCTLAQDRQAAIHNSPPVLRAEPLG